MKISNERLVPIAAISGSLTFTLLNKAAVSNHFPEEMQKVVCQLLKKLIVGRLRAISRHCPS
jgi:hypothetical protein